MPKQIFQYPRFLALHATLILIASGAAAEMSPEAAAAKEKLLAWSTSLTSFSGDYTLRQYWPGLPGRQEDIPQEWEVTYRFEGGNRYMHRIDLLEGGGHAERFYSCYAGEFRHRSDMHFPPEEVRQEDHTTVNTAVAWPDAHGVYITPELLFQGDLDGSLADFMAIGATSLHEVNGQRVLVHSQAPTSPDRINVWLDASGLPESFEYGITILASEEEARMAWGGDTFDAFLKYTEINLGQYVEINGVAFPTWARKVWWDYNQSATEAVKQARDAGADWSQAEFLANYIRATEPLSERSVQYFECEPTAITLNEPVPEQDFRVDIPHGAAMFRPNTDLNADVEIFRIPWYRRWPWPVTLALAVGSALLIALLGRWLYGRLHS